MLNRFANLIAIFLVVLFIPLSVLSDDLVNPYVSFPESAGCTVDNDSQLVALAGTHSNTTGVDDSSNLRGFAWQSDGSTLTGASVYCVDTSSDTGNMIAKLYALDTGTNRPTGSLLASVTVASSALPNSAAVHFFEFSSAYTTSNGTWYVVYFEGASGGAMNVHRNNANPLANVYYYYSYNFGTDWTEDSTTYDLRGDGVYGCAP